MMQGKSIALIMLLGVFPFLVNGQANKRFELLTTDQTGIDFENNLPFNENSNIFTYIYYYNGGGVALGDVNNDGLDDIYLTANNEPNKLYLNKGNFKFQDITEAANVAGRLDWSTGVTMADVNADGYLDIYVSHSGWNGPETRRNELFVNNGDMTFTEQAAELGLDDEGFSTQALFFDYDQDGDLDMYQLNHSTEKIVFENKGDSREKVNPDTGDRLYRNDNGFFKDVSQQAGILQNSVGFGLGVAASDLNQDGFPDIYITNDFNEYDYLYINNQDGTFTESIKSTTKHIPLVSMGVDIADFNNDLMPDIFVSAMLAEDNYRQKTTMASMNPADFNRRVRDGLHYQYMYNALQLNRGDARFSEMAQLANIGSTDWSWATLFADFDNDGWKDLFVANGYRKDITFKDLKIPTYGGYNKLEGSQSATRRKELFEKLKKVPEAKLQNYIFRNNGDLTFENTVQEWGLEPASFSNGAAYADLDNDGDLDLVVNNIDHQAFVYQNHSTENSGYVSVKFNGPATNTYGIGAKVEIFAGPILQVQENYPTRGYQSSVPPYLVFGLGSQKTIDRLTVTWPDGNLQTLTNLKVNQELTLQYSSAHYKKEIKKNKKKLFEDITKDSNVKFNHRENRFNDFQKEVLLPHKMSQFGPALAVGDVNGDALEDFFVGGASGQSGRLYLQNSNDTFTAMTGDWSVDINCEDMGAAFFDADGDKDLDLYVVSGGNEFNPDHGNLQDRLYINDGNGQFTKSSGQLPDIRHSGSVVKPNDYDNDGDLDLFVGGRLVPGQYPKPASSTLLENNGGTFIDVTKTTAPDLNELGMVTSALWTDHDKDGMPEIMVTGEWMPVTILEYNGRNFSILENDELKRNVGWWFSLAQCDMDDDGDMDYVAGNLGLNYKYKASLEEPFKVFAEDFDKNGNLDIVLGYFNEGELYPLRGRQCSSQQMPDIKMKFETYHEFGLANIYDVYGEADLNQSLQYSATNFAHSIIENLGNGQFSIKSLPQVAQLSSVNTIVIDYLDDDRFLDIVLGGNLYPVEVETVRNDASFGVYLKGDVNGDFNPVEMRESGLELDGDVRQMLPIRIGKSGKALIVANNNDQLKIVRINKQ